MPQQHPPGRLTTWLARALGRAAPALSLSKGGLSIDAPATKSFAPYFAFDRLGAPAWAPRDYTAFAREGFMQNAILYRSVRMLPQARVAHVKARPFSGRQPTEREFERWLTQDAGLTRSQARAVIRFGHKGLTTQDAAAGHPRDRLVAQISEATRLLRNP